MSSHYDDAAYYDRTYRTRREDVEYYVTLARQQRGPVLEYGVGTGRIGLPIARAGLQLVGVDASKPMLRGLARRLGHEHPSVQARVQAVHGDMRRVDLARRFSLVLCTFNTLLHLHERRDVERFLARVRAHLRPRGRFVFDFTLPRAQDLMVDPERLYRTPRIRHPTTGELTRYAERFEYDSFRQLLLTEMQFESLESTARWKTPIVQRQFFPREIEALLHYNGFWKLHWSMDFTGRAPDESADWMVVSCCARPSPRRS